MSTRTDWFPGAQEVGEMLALLMMFAGFLMGLENYRRIERVSHADAQLNAEIANLAVRQHEMVYLLAKERP